MSLVLGNPVDLFAIASTAFVVRAIAADGATTWFEGLLLVGIYVRFGLAFYFLCGGPGAATKCSSRLAPARHL